jgi:hypothetical protein
MKGTYDVVEDIRKYDRGELDETKTIELFQYLIDAEIVWMLNDRYGRVAQSLIEAGHCHGFNALPAAKKQLAA